MADEDSLTLARYVIRDCKARGLVHYFGIPGSGSPMDLMEAAREEGLEFVIAGHESSAVISAAYYGLFKGTAGLMVGIKGVGLDGDEVRAHLENAMSVTRLALDWEDQLSFMLDDELTIRRLRFGDDLKEKLDDDAGDDRVARFDAAFSLMTLELSRLLPALLEAFGGEDRSALSA